MSGAQVYGARLLEEVKEESLASLIRSLNALTPDLTPTLIPPLDALINAFTHPPLSRQQQIYHHQNSAAVHSPTHHSTRPAVPTVIELASPASNASGKSHLLYAILARSLLPSQFGGKDGAVALFDLKLSFDVLTLSNVMRDIINTTHAQTPAADIDIEKTVKDSLDHLLLFHPTSTPSLTATLTSLPSHLKQQPYAHSSASRSLDLIVLLELSTFLPRDRLDAALDTETNYLVSERWRQLVSSLRAVSEEFGAVVVGTDYVARATEGKGERVVARPHTPGVWGGFVRVRLVVEGRSGREDDGEGEEGGERFRVRVNYFGAEEWEGDVTDAVDKLKRDGKAEVRFEVAGDGGVRFVT